MKLQLLYIVDNKGKKKSVILPINQWKKLSADYLQLTDKLNSLNSSKNGNYK